MTIRPAAISDLMVRSLRTKGAAESRCFAPVLKLPRPPADTSAEDGSRGEEETGPEGQTGRSSERKDDRGRLLPRSGRRDRDRVLAAGPPCVLRVRLAARLSRAMERSRPRE